VTLAREVAVAPLWAAADELARIAPNDPLVGELMRKLEDAQAPEPVTNARHVVWF
jgi:hypothetical protein